MYTKEELWLLHEKYGGVVTDEFVSDCMRLKKGTPLAYLIGHVPFFGSTIFLDSHPLIPRPETEWWTEKFVESLPRDTNLHVLDMCCGSGAIGISILRHRPCTTVTFADIRRDHLDTVQKNLEANAITSSRAVCIVSDMFESIQGTFDHIVANPPYIPGKRTLPESVLQHEPHDALFGGEDGFHYLHTLVSHAQEYIQKGGSLYAEIDSTQSTQALEEAKQNGAKETSILSDQYGVPRVLVAHY